MQQTQSQLKIRINHNIRVPQVRLILEDDSSYGVIDTYQALKLAQDQGLDLIEINPKTSPPIVKIGDFGKFKYELKKKQSEAKKNQKNQELKELTFRPNTDVNDLSHKVEQAKQFLSDGNKVKFTIRFRGREVTHPQVGKDKLLWIFTELSAFIQAAPSINMEGKIMSVILYPVKK
jgi:translation initiation factor IF-3